MAEEDLTSLAARILPWAEVLPREIVKAASAVLRGVEGAEEQFLQIAGVGFPRIAVESSNIDFIGPYSAVTGDLYVVFKGGREYRYIDIPFEEYIAFVTADSKGTYLNAFIKDVYDYDRL